MSQIDICSQLEDMLSHHYRPLAVSNPPAPSPPLVEGFLHQNEDCGGKRVLTGLLDMTDLERRLVLSCYAFFDDVLQDRPSSIILSHFSTMTPPLLEHTHISNPREHISKFSGLSGVRSYYDMLSMQFSRKMYLRSDTVTVLVEQQAVHAMADVYWTWRVTGEQFLETVNCYVQFDEATKICAITATTVTDKSTSILEAIPRSLSGQLEVCVSPMYRA